MTAKRLLLLSTAGNIGGTERVTLSLARQFTARGWTVRAVFAPDPATPALLAWAHDQGVEAEVDPAVTPMGRPRGAGEIAALRRFVRAFRPHVVNIHYGGNHLSMKDVLAVRLAGVRRCFLNAHLPTPWAGAGAQKKALTRLAASLSRRVIAHSRHMRQSLMETGIPMSRIAVIPNGVLPPARENDKARARQSLGIPGDAFVVGSMGRLAPIKAMDDLIRAVAALESGSASCHLVIAGDGPEKPSLEKLAADLMPGRVTFLGHVTDAGDFFAAIDVFALTSLLEGYPLVYLEAAMHGLPCVGTDVGGVAEAIDDGKTGFLVPPRDSAAATSAIARLRDDDLRRRMGDAARARARAEFSEERMAERYEQTFCE